MDKLTPLVNLMTKNQSCIILDNYICHFSASFGTNNVLNLSTLPTPLTSSSNNGHSTIWKSSYKSWIYMYENVKTKNVMWQWKYKNNSWTQWNKINPYQIHYFKSHNTRKTDLFQIFALNFMTCSTQSTCNITYTI